MKRKTGKPQKLCEKPKKLFFVIVDITGKSAEEAISNWRKGQVVGLLHRRQEIKELASLIGIDAVGNEWCDEDHAEPETKLGF